MTSTCWQTPVISMFRRPYAPEQNSYLWHFHCWNYIDNLTTSQPNIIQIPTKFGGWAGYCQLMRLVSHLVARGIGGDCITSTPLVVCQRKVPWELALPHHPLTDAFRTSHVVSRLGLDSTEGRTRLIIKFKQNYEDLWHWMSAWSWPRAGDWHTRHRQTYRAWFACGLASARVRSAHVTSLLINW